MADDSQGLKSAYELALERLEGQGIERPREESFSPERKEQVAEARRRASAKLAELEILHRDRLAKAGDRSEEDEEHYRRERRRIEEDRDRTIARIRRQVEG